MIAALLAPGFMALVLASAATPGAPTQAEAEAMLASLRSAAASRDCAAILSLVDDAFEIKTTLRLGPSERLFLHTRQELVDELPKILTPAAKPRVQTHLLSLTAAQDAPAALMKYQWAITLNRPDGEVRIEATGGAILQRSNGRVIATRANQLIKHAGRDRPARATGPQDSKDNTKVWEAPSPKKKAADPQEPAAPPPKTEIVPKP